jgi:hypothetical protein
MASELRIGLVPYIVDIYIGMVLYGIYERVFDYVAVISGHFSEHHAILMGKS